MDPVTVNTPSQIRRCTDADWAAMLALINEAARAYQGIIPDDCWHEPYMPQEALLGDIRDGVEFWGVEHAGALVGVMGIQDKGPVALIRHAYVRTSERRGGLGTRLLHHLERLTAKPILIGTWAAAIWAIRFYERNGYTALGRDETEQLLKQFWTIPERQMATSTVLAGRGWTPH